MKKYLKVIVSFAVSAVILFLLYSKMATVSFSENIASASVYWVALYFTISAIEPVIRGTRWHYLLMSGTLRTSIYSKHIARAGND